MIFDQRTEHQTFMVACLHMACTYLKIVEHEVSLYRQTPGSKIVPFNFKSQREDLEALIGFHRQQYNQKPEKKKLKLKKRVLL